MRDTRTNAYSIVRKVHRLNFEVLVNGSIQTRENFKKEQSKHIYKVSLKRA